MMTSRVTRLQVRQHTNLPFILDENMDSIEAILTAYKHNACDVINLKISKFGGLSKAKQVRNTCQPNAVHVAVD